MFKEIRQFIVQAPFAGVKDLTGRKFIVTGCAVNSLGYATAKTLLSWGAEVTITTRSRCDDIVDALKAELPLPAHALIHAHPLDLSNAVSTEAFAKWYRAEHKALDVLINNAGIHLDLLSQWKEPKLSDDVIGGSYYRDCKVAEASADTIDASIARRLWEQTVDGLQGL